jgi:hypothetical protein
MFLGWTRGPQRDYFIRQLRDIKISVRVETFGAPEMDLCAAWCGRALALSHARSGQSAMLSGYMGKSDAFDKAIAEFSIKYADQNEKDHAALDRAVRQGKVNVGCILNAGFVRTTLSLCLLPGDLTEGRKQAHRRRSYT